MGLLSLGHPLDWYETKPIADYVKQHGIIQFINLYHRLKDRQGDWLKWGDEIEYQMIKFDHENKRAYVSLRGTEILEKLMADENHSDPTKNEFLWRPEYAEYMLEGTPGMPYGGVLPCFNVVEDNMKRRRAKAVSLLGKDETIFSIPCFPRLGCPDYTRPATRPNSAEGFSHSLFFPDDAIYSAHPRFKNLTRNIRQRRGEKVVINVPVFKDVNTPSPFREDFSKMGDHDGQAARNSKDDHIYMDAMGFGMGCCCLQVTFQAVNINEARWLYDQLTPITPVVLALSAATPIFRGYLADVDSRWNIISASVDDRTEEERGLKPLKENKFNIPRSRYDTTDCYIYACSAGYNDIPLEYEKEHLQKLIEGGVDDLLAKHVAHLFIRDPLQVFKERIEQNDLESSEHFETIQSSNWRNMRFKPPPVDNPSIGWRVEFRPAEVQLTDFENAAYVCFVVLLTRVIISFRLTFLIPISKVNENMERAQKRDAVLNQKFYFRRMLATCDSPPDAVKVCACSEVPADTTMADGNGTASAPGKPPSDDYIEMTINEIVNGKPPDFPGLVPLMQIYLDSADVDVDTRCTIQQYLKFIKQRASGQLWTLAHWMREFVKRHPAYEKDSVVSEEINYDLLKTMDDIAQGRAHCPCLLGVFRTKAQIGIPDAVDKAEIMYNNYSVGRAKLQQIHHPNDNLNGNGNGMANGQDQEHMNGFLSQATQ